MFTQYGPRAPEYPTRTALMDSETTMMKIETSLLALSSTQLLIEPETKDVPNKPKRAPLSANLPRAGVAHAPSRPSAALEVSLSASARMSARSSIHAGRVQHHASCWWQMGDRLILRYANVESGLRIRRYWVRIARHAKRQVHSQRSTTGESLEKSGGSRTNASAT
jgi:hypothetical protein